MGGWVSLQGKAQQQQAHQHGRPGGIHCRLISRVRPTRAWGVEGKGGGGEGGGGQARQMHTPRARCRLQSIGLKKPLGLFW